MFRTGYLTRALLISLLVLVHHKSIETTVRFRNHCWILAVKVASGVCLEQMEEQCTHKAILSLPHVFSNALLNLILAEVSFCLAVLAALFFHKRT